MLTDFMFKRAVPIWEKDGEKTINRTLDFAISLSKNQNATLYLTASTIYSLFINGELIAHGPARCAKGFYKVDELFIGDRLTKDENAVLIRVTGYNLNSFAYVDASSFLCAEILDGEKLLFATSESSSAFEFKERVQKSPRYSYQRALCEVYNYSPCQNKQVILTKTESKCFLKRELPYPEYERLFGERLYKRGSFSATNDKGIFHTRFTVASFDDYKLFKYDDLATIPPEDYSTFDFKLIEAVNENAKTFDLSKNTFADLDMGKIQTGFFECQVEFLEKGELYIGFGETEEELHAPYHKGKINIVKISGEKGVYRLCTAEAYVAKYFRFIATASLKITAFKVIEYAFPKSKVAYDFKCNDPKLQKVWDAALLTFRANAVDIFSDCPSRERAGWLCDSFFTGRTEFAVTGKNQIEKAFLQNFLLPEKFENLPEGMLPMCYPADSLNGEFIPTWAMWYGLEVYDYFTRSRDFETVNSAKERLYSLLKYFKGFENEYGLLENLDGWIFVEWSFANELTDGVNFPVNMVYAAFKSALGEMYGDRELILEAENLRKTIKEWSVAENGFYRDRALREDGKLIVQNDITEVCQYYAFFFKIADFKKEKALFETMVNDFGAIRETHDKYPEIHQANAFFGYYLRIDLLMQQGLLDLAKENITDFFLHMAELTGTLWEHKHGGESCNHGFASYVLCWLKELAERN